MSSHLTDTLETVGGQSGLADGNLMEIIGILINICLSLLGIVFLILVIYAGYLWLTAAGDEKNLQKAKNTLITAISGLIITLSAYAITNFVLNQIQASLGNGNSSQNSSSSSSSNNSSDTSNNTNSQASSGSSSGSGSDSGSGSNSGSDSSDTSDTSSGGGWLPSSDSGSTASTSPSPTPTLETTEDVSGAPTQVSLGFNNAEQVVETDSGSYLVFVSENKLYLATRDSLGSITATTELASGSIQLPAIARSDSYVAVAWVETSSGNQEIRARVSTDDGISFGSEQILGNGTGVSLASSQYNIISIWHQENTDGTAQLFTSQSSGDTWSSPLRLDSSDAAPVWASIALKDSNAYAVWRDDRDGFYSIWLRRSLDGGTTWLSEQHIVTSSSGDPDVCVSDNGKVWVAHHGRGNISVIHSSDGGVSFSSGQIVGYGYFAHLDCTDSFAAVAWEYTLEDAHAENKEVGWALMDSSANIIDSGTINDGSAVAATAFLFDGSRYLELLWVKVTGSEALVGALRKQVLETNR